jgi:hypothetical protein
VVRQGVDERLAKLLDCRPLWNEPSPAPKLWVITSAMWLSITYGSACIICWMPWTPRVSAVGMLTSMMLASGAVACDRSTSSATSSAHRL